MRNSLGSVVHLDQNISTSSSRTGRVQNSAGEMSTEQLILLLGTKYLSLMQANLALFTFNKNLFGTYCVQDTTK